MRVLLLLRFLLEFVWLALAVVLSLRLQALWVYDEEMVLPLALWAVLLAVWLRRLAQRRKDQKPLERRALVLPLCAALVAISGVAHLPLRVRFWKEKAALQEVQKQLPFKPGKAFRVDGVRPFQVAQSNGDTRFLLWHGKTFSDNIASGFAYCPNDAGCRRAWFGGYWRLNDGAPYYVPDPPIEFYWDYANGPTDYLSLGGGWYATKVSAEDVGDAGD